MFNIVKRRDFMLAGDLPTKEEAEKVRDRYGSEYVVVETVSGHVHRIGYARSVRGCRVFWHGLFHSPWRLRIKD